MIGVRASIVESLLVAACAVGVVLPPAVRGQSLDQMRHDIREGVTPPPAAPAQAAPPPPTVHQTGGNPGIENGDSSEDPSDGIDLEGGLLLVALGGVVAAAPISASVRLAQR